MTIKVGIIGFGLSGRYFQAPFLKMNPHYEVVAVSTSRVEDVRAYLPGTKVVETAQEIINDPSIELVINCGPNAVHYSLSAAALKSGKNVVIEKPFSNNASEAKSLIELAAAQGRTLCAFQNRRWDGDFLTVKRLIDDGRLGEVMRFTSSFDRFHPQLRPGSWREQDAPGSGTWFDLGAHMVDQMLVLFGIPDTVTADIFPQRNNSVTDDSFHVLFSYGKRRVVLKSCLYSSATPRFEVLGDKATYIKYGMDPQEAQLRGGMEPSDLSYGFEESSEFGFITVYPTQQSHRVTTEKGDFMKFFDLLHAHITTGKSLSPVSLDDSLRTIQLIELARESAALGRTLEVNL